MKTYKHIFFDLDHTLWDFKANSGLALQQIFESENLAVRGVPSFEKFHKKYLPINDRYWARYHNGFATKEQVRIGRFYDTLKEFGLKDESLAGRMAETYISISPKMNRLFPDALEVLKYLQEKYKLHLITNGFAEVQWMKLEHSGLKPFFEHIIISEEVGTQKPDKEIFEIVFKRAGTIGDECLMIGDNFNTDILGAKNAGMDQVFFNPEKTKHREKATYEISSLVELKTIL